MFGGLVARHIAHGVRCRQSARLCDGVGCREGHGDDGPEHGDQPEYDKPAMVNVFCHNMRLPQVPDLDKTRSVANRPKLTSCQLASRGRAEAE